jgi:hypothetical protein
MAEIRANDPLKKAIEPKISTSKNGKSKKNAPTSKIHEINFDYIKSNHFRVIHVDGVHGGVSPKGLIQIAFFSERLPIPQSEIYELNQGSLGKRTSVEERKAMIREVEVETLIDLQLAKVIVKWIEEKIVQAESLRKEIENK